MKRLLTATALTSAALTGAALADAHSGMFPTVDLQAGQNYLASTLMGTRVYAAEQEFEIGNPVAAGAQAEWDDIGEIGDVVISAQGELQAVIVDVGGFLGIGEREVAVEWSALRPVAEEDDPSEVFLVINASAETLETAPEFERVTAADLNMGEPLVTDTPATAEITEETSVTGVDMDVEPEETALAADGAEVEAAEITEARENLVAEPAVDGERMLLRTPMFEREGYEPVVLDELNTEDLTGMRIYGADDEDIGEISELIMAADGTSIERAVLDIGGFLGMGEHQIAVTMDELQILRDADGLDRAYIDATQEELEAQPEYEG